MGGKIRASSTPSLCHGDNCFELDRVEITRFVVTKGKNEKGKGRSFKFKIFNLKRNLLLFDFIIQL